MTKIALGAIGVIILLFVATNASGYYHDYQNRKFCDERKGVLTDMPDGAHHCDIDSGVDHIVLTWSWR